MWREFKRWGFDRWRKRTMGVSGGGGGGADDGGL